MEFEALVDKCAGEVKRHMRLGNYSRDHYGLCIHIVCKGYKKLKTAVAKRLGEEGQLAKEINKLKAQEAQEQ